ncbi:Glycine-rich protein 2 [Babesia microti strain RI]|uniref:Glycine-rich protein 2 n=1 Tax=Babesia microti (strain RI) TaxID=1133968 RepID=I7J8C4_BABMR|nr:Glycine-rich protein 2 [Babesia microti strain RI]CCF75318.1 Glycine-rich protein 2 [Babesia microti strain RI]|eukprot:XP_012649726.1 Glycine-rich protein 2 [Babesia microti strain RI]
MVRLSGKCKWFNSIKGYGFITLETGEDVFVHQSEIHAVGFRSLAENEPVELEVINEDNRKKAVKVTGPKGDYVKGADDTRYNDGFNPRSSGYRSGNGSGGSYRNNDYNDRY